MPSALQTQQLAAWPELKAFGAFLQRSIFSLAISFCFYATNFCFCVFVFFLECPHSVLQHSP